VPKRKINFPPIASQKIRFKADLEVRSSCILREWQTKCDRSPPTIGPQARIKHQTFSRGSAMSPELLVVSKLKTLTIDRQHEVLDFIEFLQAKQAMLESRITPTSTPFTFDENATPIWEIAAAITNQIPDDEWRKLPTDLAMHFDQYQKQGQD
jgi:hypothetical protein